MWDCEEFLYHTWHPGQAGTVDYCGPHDGRHMSTTALEAIETGRVLPLVENPAIEALRNGNPPAEFESQLQLAIDPEWIHDWSATAVAALPRIVAQPTISRARSAFEGRLTRWQQLRLVPFVLKMLLRQYRIKYDKLRHAAPSPAETQGGPRRTAAVGEALRKLRGARAFLPAALEYSKYLIRTCWLHLAWVRSQGFHRIILWGDPHAASIVNRLAGLTGIATVTCRRAEEMRHSDLPVLVAAFQNGSRLRAQLAELGVGDERIVTFC